MLQEQLDQIQKTGFHALSDHPAMQFLGSTPSIFVTIALLAVGLLSLVLVLNRSWPHGVVALGFIMAAGAIFALATNIPGAAYKHERQQVINSAMQGKYGYISSGQLDPSQWGEDTTIVVHHDGANATVRPEIDDGGNLVLWHLDCKEVPHLSK